MDRPLTSREKTLWMSDVITEKYSHKMVCRVLRVYSSTLNPTVIMGALVQFLYDSPDLLSRVVCESGIPTFKSIRSACSISVICKEKRIREEELLKDITCESRKSINLNDEPLIRTVVYSIRDRKSEFAILVSVHPIVADYYSIVLILKKILEYISSNRRSGVTVVPVSLDSNYSESLRYWTGHLSPSPHFSALPVNRSKCNTNLGSGSVYEFTLSNELSNRISFFAKAYKLRVDTVFIASFKYLINRYDGNQEVNIGLPMMVPSSIRNLSGDEIGNSLNWGVLRSVLRMEMNFYTLCQTIERNLDLVFQHRKCPYEAVIDKLSPPRVNGLASLFNIFYQSPELIDSDNWSEFEVDCAFGESSSWTRFSNIDVRVIGLNRRQLVGDITFSLRRRGNVYLTTLTYSDCFYTNSVEALSKRWITNLEKFLQNPCSPLQSKFFLDNKRLSGLKRVSPVLNDHINEKSMVKKKVCFFDRFQTNVRLFSSKVATIFEGRKVTYQQLYSHAAGLAEALEKKSVNYGDKVGILLPFSDNWVPAILAIWMSKKVYVPLNTDFPVKKIKAICDDADIKCILTNQKNFDIAQECTLNSVIVIEEIDRFESNLEKFDELKNEEKDDAYILYTSGSTGVPKGVLQNHGNLLFQLETYVQDFSITKSDVLVQFASFSWDASLTDFLVSLMTGGSVYLHDIKRYGISGLAENLIEYNVSFWHSTPSLFRTCVNSIQNRSAFKSIRCVLLAAEEVYLSDYKLFKYYFQDSAMFANGYGASESSFLLRMIVNKSHHFESLTIPVGFPLRETEVYLVDDCGCETYYFGEIVVRSAYLSPEYYKNSKGTKRAFITLQDSCKGRFYRTGDYGYRLSNGEILYGNRKDRMIKIRGYRVELGELEYTLVDHELVSECVVLPIQRRNDSEKELVAFCIPNPNNPKSSIDLRHNLTTLVPEYMIPTNFIILEEMPRSPNGKVDTSVLVNEYDQRYFEKTHYKIQSGSDANLLAVIWKKVLNHNNFDTISNFFDVGGTSLKAVRVQSEIKKKLNVDIELRDIFINPNLESLCILLTEKGGFIKNSFNLNEKDISNRMLLRRNRRRTD